MKKKLVYTVLSFALVSGAHAQGFIQHGGFESWISENTVNEPQGWYTLNMLTLFGLPETTTQTTDAHGGTYAALLETKESPNVNLPGLLTSALIIDGSGNPDLNLARVPFAYRPKNMSFFYKYTPAEGDSCSALMVLTRWNLAEQRTDTIGVAAITLGDTVSGYTQVVIDFEYNNPLMPDSAMLIISSSANGFEPTVGSKLYVDDFAIGFETGLKEHSGLLKHVSVFPNPASGQFIIHTKETGFTYRITDVQGKVVLSGISALPAQTIETTLLNSGLYVVEVKSSNGSAYQRIIIN